VEETIEDVEGELTDIDFIQKDGAADSISYFNNGHTGWYMYSKETWLPDWLPHKTRIHQAYRSLTTFILLLVVGKIHRDVVLVGGGLRDAYKLHSFHFHWGNSNGVGSEHTVDGKSFPLEVLIFICRPQ
jgi:hypothetical protein